MVQFASQAKTCPRRAWSLRLHLIAFALVLIVPIAAVSGLAIQRFAASERSVSESRASAVARAGMSDVDRAIAGDIAILNTLATSLFLDTGDYRSFYRLAARIARLTHANVLLLDPTLQELVNTRVAYGTQLPKTAAPEAALKVIETREPQVSGLFMGTVAQHYVFDVNAPVIRDGKVAYVLIITLEPERILDILKAQHMPPGWVLTAVDRDHRVIARTRNSASYVGRQGNTGPDSLFGDRQSGRFRAANFDGEPTVGAFTTSILTGWKFAAWVPTAILEGPLRRSWELFATGIVALLLVSLAAAWVFGRMMARPMDVVRADATAFGHGAVVPERHFGLREANEVSAAFRAAALERQRQDAHLKLLVGELSHRTKNLLTVMQAMVRQTKARSGSLDDFESRFGGRLLGLGRSIDLLVRGDWRGASLRDLAAAQLGPFAEPGGGRLELDGPEIRLRPEATQQIGMALHELATNSTKYGALSVGDGQVRLCWSLCPGAEAPETVEIVWRESGGPRVARTPTERGFGRMVIEQAVAATLQGEVLADFAPEGLRWTLRLPARFLAGDGEGNSGAGLP